MRPGDDLLVRGHPLNVPPTLQQRSVLAPIRYLARRCRQKVASPFLGIKHGNRNGGLLLGQSPSETSPLLPDLGAHNERMPVYRD